MILARLNVILGFLACLPLFYLDQGLPWSAVGVVLLVGLISMSRVVGGKASHVADLADSLYFLGFVLTLLSLFVAFFQLSGQGLRYESADQAMVSLFGVIGGGLSTTITGLMMRELILLGGAARPQVEMGEVTAEDFKNVVDKLNSALQLGENAVEVSRIAADSAAAYRQTYETYSESLTIYTESLHEFRDNVFTPVTEMKQELGDTLSGFRIQLQTTNELFGESRDHFIAAGKSLVDLKEDLNSFGTEIPTAFGNMTEMVKDSTVQIETLSDRYDVLAKALDKDFSGLDSIATILPELVTGMQGVGAGYKDLAGTSQAMSRLKDELSAFATSVPASLAAVDTSAQEVATQLEQLTGNYEALVLALGRDFDHLKNISEKLPSEKIWDPLVLLGDTMPGVRTELRQSSKRLEETSRTLEEASRTFADSQHILNSLVRAMNESPVAKENLGQRRKQNRPKPRPTPEPDDGFGPGFGEEKVPYRKPSAQDEVIVPGESKGLRAAFRRFFGGKK